MAVLMRTGRDTFITTIGTIVPAIALPSRHYALAVGTSEVIGWTSAIHLVRTVRAIVITVTLILFIYASIECGTFELVRLACDVAVNLIAAVIAMDLTIAAVIVLYALAGATAEFTLRAIAHLTVQLIAAVATVVLIIATPTSRYAFGVIALEVGGVAALLRRMAGGWFILTIRTVVLAITTPSHRYAATGITLEIAWLTCHQVTTFLIRFVCTVGISITYPHIWHTTIITTLELLFIADERRTSSFVLSVRAVIDTVAFLSITYAERARVRRRFAFHVILEAGEFLAIPLIRIIATVIDVITNG